MKVVIVEDDAVLALLLEEICRTSGHRVVGAAAAASTAIPLIKRARPDCLLLDYSLEGERDGLELLQEARRIAPSLFCVMITAWDINDIAGRMEGAQPDRIMRKPIHTETLVNILAAHDKSLGDSRAKGPTSSLRATFRPTRPIAAH